MWLPPPDIVNREQRYEIEKVLDSQMRGRTLLYLVRWNGYGHEENLWILEHNLDAPQLIGDFHKTHLNAPKCINAIHFSCMSF